MNIFVNQKYNDMNFEMLLATIEKTHVSLIDKTISKINYYHSLRNWLIGYYIVEFEQNGDDRAAYGKIILRNIAERLIHIKGLSMTNLKLFRQFYQTYPQIGQTVSDQFEKLGFPLMGKELSNPLTGENLELELKPGNLLAQLNFSHFIELITVKDSEKRHFYEVQAIKNAWTVRDLARAINTLLYERTGLSHYNAAVTAKLKNDQNLNTTDVIKDPYILDFLGLEEKAAYTEHDLETAIIDNLQHFLTEMGRGFCFEARQKRITFDNVHYRIDLVFYHRILKSHILIDLKLGRYDHADAGQMNLYLNYYRSNEMTEGDNAPIGIILCADKNDTLVKYTTAGLSNEIFVSEYLIKLPSRETLKNFIQNELTNLQRAKVTKDLIDNNVKQTATKRTSPTFSAEDQPAKTD